MPLLNDVSDSYKLRIGFNTGPFANVGALVNGLTMDDFGPRPFIPTIQIPGKTFYASPTGSGTAATFAAPVSILQARSMAQPGDLWFLRGGTYTVTATIALTVNGTASNPIIWESYPGELAVIDGSGLPDATQTYFRIDGNYNRLRNVKVTGMPYYGLYMTGSDCLIENCIIDENRLWGIAISSQDSGANTGVKGSRNIIRSCIASNNSGAGKIGAPYNDGNSSDGISIDSGVGNIVEYCYSHSNSDDGIDFWHSKNSIARYCIAYRNGLGSGNGMGFKGGGGNNANWGNNLVEYCVSIENKNGGFVCNTGDLVTFRNNTSIGNKAYGFSIVSANILENNISFEETAVSGSQGAGVKNNSWQMASSYLAFESTKYGEPGFLIPTFAGRVKNRMNGFNYKFSTATTAADPGSGFIRLNNATPSSSTAMYVDVIDQDGVNINNHLSRITTGKSGTLRTNNGAVITFRVSGTPTLGGSTSTGYYTIPIDGVDAGSERFRLNSETKMEIY